MRIRLVLITPVLFTKDRSVVCTRPRPGSGPRRVLPAGPSVASPGAGLDLQEGTPLQIPAEMYTGAPIGWLAVCAAPGEPAQLTESSTFL